MCVSQWMCSSDRTLLRYNARHKRFHSLCTHTYFCFVCISGFHSFSPSFVCCCHFSLCSNIFRAISSLLTESSYTCSMCNVSTLYNVQLVLHVEIEDVFSIIIRIFFLFVISTHAVASRTRGVEKKNDQ